MAITGAAIPGTLSAADRQTDLVLQIWRSEHVDQYRWVLTFGLAEHEVFHGNAESFNQAMRDIEHCCQIRCSGQIENCP